MQSSKRVVLYMVMTFIGLFFMISAILAIYNHYQKNGSIYSYDYALFIVHLMIAFIVLIPFITFIRKQEPITEYIKHNPISLLLIIIVISAYFVFHKYIICNYFFVFSDIGGDTAHEYIPVINMVANKIKDNDFSFWEFNWGAGIDILNNQSLVMDPFNFILYLSNVLVDQRLMLYMVVIVQITRISLCGIFTFKYLDLFKIRTASKIVISVVCSFNGFIMVWGQHYFFATACVYVTLLFWLLESYMRKKTNAFLLMLAISFSLMFSLYTSYMIALTCFIYVVFRTIYYFKDVGFKETVLSIIRLSFVVFVAALLSGIIVFPAYYQLTQVSQRVSGGQSIFVSVKNLLFEQNSRDVLKGIFIRLFSNNLQGIGNNYFGSINYYELRQQYFSPVFVLLFLVFFIHNILYSKGKRIFYATVMLCMFAFTFNLAVSLVYNMGVNTATRYSFVVIPVFAVIGAKAIDYIMDSKKSVSIIVSFAIIILMFLLFREYKQNDLSSYALIIIFINLILAICMILISFDADRIRKYLIYFTYFVIFVAMGLSVYDGYLSSSQRDTWSSDSHIVNDDYVTSNILGDISEESIVRVEKTYFDSALWNDSLTENYSGISYYNTTYNKFIMDFVSNVWPEIIYINEVGPLYTSFSNDYENDQMASLLGIRYIISGEEIDNPSYSLGAYDETTGTYLYINDKAGELGILFDKAVSEKDLLEEGSTENRRNALCDSVVLDDESYLETGIEKGDLDGLNSEYDYSENSVKFRKKPNDGTICSDVEVEDEKILFISVPYDIGWKAYINGKKIEINKANFGFCALDLKEGKYKIELKYTTPLIKEGAICSIMGMLILIIYVVGSRRMKKNKLS